MTEEERKMLHDLHDRLSKDTEARHAMAGQMQEMIAEMRSMKEQAQRVNTYLMEPTGPGKPSRAQALDGFLDALNAGKFFTRAVVYAAGFLTALIALLAYFKGLPR